MGLDDMHMTGIIDPCSAALPAQLSGDHILQTAGLQYSSCTTPSAGLFEEQHLHENTEHSKAWRMHNVV
jgi:hypothetical protein